MSAVLGYEQHDTRYDGVYGGCRASGFDAKNGTGPPYNNAPRKVACRIIGCPRSGVKKEVGNETRLFCNEFLEPEVYAEVKKKNKEKYHERHGDDKLYTGSC